MEALRNLAKRITQLSNKKLFITIVDKQAQQYYISLNLYEQLEEGELSDGTQLPNYSKTSVEFYGKRPGAYQLKDTGRFWDTFEITGLNFEGFDVQADGQLPDGDNIFDGVGQMEDKDWTDAILGLNDENQNMFIEVMTDNTIEAILDYILQDN